jgi:hypothetical protein
MAIAIASASTSTGFVIAAIAFRTIKTDNAQSSFIHRGFILFPSRNIAELWQFAML